MGSWGDIGDQVDADERARREALRASLDAQVLANRNCEALRAQAAVLVNDFIARMIAAGSPGLQPGHGVQTEPAGWRKWLGFQPTRPRMWDVNATSPGTENESFLTIWTNGAWQLSVTSHASEWPRRVETPVGHPAYMQDLRYHIALLMRRHNVPLPP